MPLRDQRRRRVLTDELIGSGISAAPVRPIVRKRSKLDAEPPKPKHYAAAARRDRQPRLIDLVPSRRFALALWWCVGLAGILLLELAYLWMPALARATNAPDAAVLDLASHGSLAGWFSALLLATAALAAALVYSLRRHRVDDYHGRYRVWLWTAAGLLALSVDQTTAVFHLGRDLTTALVSRWNVAEPGAAWTGVSAALLGLFAARVLVEIYRSWAASVAWLGGALCFSLAVGVEHDWITAAFVSDSVMLAAGARMLAHLLLLSAVGLYARHVMLDAEGLLPARRRRVEDGAKPERRALRTEPPEDTTTERVDPPQQSKPHVAARSDLGSTVGIAPAQRPAPQPAAKPAPSPGPLSGLISRSATPKPTAPVQRRDDDNDDGVDDDDSQLSSSNLSRAERKRLKRELRRQQRGE